MDSSDFSDPEIEDDDIAESTNNHSDHKIALADHQQLPQDSIREGAKEIDAIDESDEEGEQVGISEHVLRGESRGSGQEEQDEQDEEEGQEEVQESAG